jgi:hypothetical protein
MAAPGRISLRVPNGPLLVGPSHSVARATARASHWHARAVVTETVTVTPLSRFPQRKLQVERCHNAPLCAPLSKPAAAAAASAAVAAARAAPGAARPCHAAMGPPQHRRAHSADPRERPRVGRAIHLQASARHKPASGGIQVVSGRGGGPGPGSGGLPQWQRRARACLPAGRGVHPFTLSASGSPLLHIYSQLGRGPTNLSIVQMLGLLRVGYAAAS